MTQAAGEARGRGAARPALRRPVRAAQALVRLGGALSTLLILGAFGLTIYAVGMRYLANAPLQWSDDATGWMLVALIMLGTAEALRRDSHIAIDLLTTHLKGRARVAQRVFADLAVLGFAAVLGISAWEAIDFARGFGAYTSGSVEVPLWWVQAPLVAGAVLLALTALARIVLRVGGERA